MIGDAAAVIPPKLAMYFQLMPENTMTNIPEQKISMAVPRSGCLIINRHGKERISSESIK